MEMLHWRLDPELAREMKEHYKARIAPSYKGKGAAAIVQEFTFDDVAPELTLEECETFLHFIEQKILRIPLSGMGIEMGGGPGTWSAIIARSPHVEKVYALDACEPIVTLFPEVAAALLPGQEHKLVPVVGDFNAVELPDNSLDFAFDYFSLHHSTDLPRTFAEMHRVLKPGSVVLCFDKARPDVLTDREIAAMLAREYPHDFKLKMGLAPGAHHTRRMNGENEYRLRQWREAFLGAGFSRFEHFNIARTVSGNPLIAMGKRAFSKFPPRLQARLTSFVINPNRRGPSNISADHRVYSLLALHFPKEISVMIAGK